MRSFLEQYGTAIFTLVLVTILIAFASPMGKTIKSAINTQIKNVDDIGSEEIKDNKEIYIPTGEKGTTPFIYKGKAKIDNITGDVYSGTFNIFQLMNTLDYDTTINGVHIIKNGTNIKITGTSNASCSISISKGIKMSNSEMRSEGGGYTLPSDYNYKLKLFVEKENVSDYKPSFSIINNNINDTIIDINSSNIESPTHNYDLNWGQLYWYMPSDCTFDCEYNLGLFISNFDSTYRTEKTSKISKIETSGIYEIGDLTIGNCDIYPVQLETKKSCKIAWFGDSLSQLQILPHRVGTLMNSTVYDCSIAGSTLTYTDQLWSPLSVLGMTESIVSGDFSTQDKAVVEIAKTTGINQNGKQENINYLKSIDFSTLDKIVIFAGTNDSYNNDYVAVNTDLTKFKDGMKEIFRNVQTKYPDIKIYVITPPYRGDYVGLDKHGNRLIDFVNAEIEVCNELNIPVFDFYHNSGVNEDNIHDYLKNDLLHQNEKGDILWAEKIAEWLMSMD